MATLVAPNQKSPVEDVEALHKAFKGIIYLYSIQEKCFANIIK